MTTASIREREQEFERVVAEHVAACEQAASAAVQRAFGSARAGRPRPRTRGTSKRSRASGRRRTPEEVAELGDRFYAAVCAQPGESMGMLAAEVGAPPRDLRRPVTLLKRAGRVRSVGQRQHTRYFPMAAESSESR